MRSAAGRKAAEERARIEKEFAAAVPQKCIREWTGWQTKSLLDVEERYGCPIGRATVELPAVFRWIRALLKKHGGTIRAENEPEPLRDQILAERLHRERLLRQQTEGLLCDVAVVREQLQGLAGELRGVQQRALRAGSVEEVLADLGETLDQFEERISKL